MKVNLGCGRDVRKGWVNIDKFDGPGVDVIMDASGRSMPFDANSVDEILASHVLEHIHDWENVVLELHRILKPGGLLTVRVPYGVDPTAWHVRSFYSCTMDHFIENLVPGYGPPARGHGGYDAGWGIFHLMSRKINRRFPFAWHIRRYLKIPVPTWLSPVGVRAEIVWKLVKV